eukprot:1968826-Prymnesium_polylepis.1
MPRASALPTAAASSSARCILRARRSPARERCTACCSPAVDPGRSYQSDGRTAALCSARAA